MNRKLEKYKRMYNQLAQLFDKSPTTIAQLSTLNAILYHKMQTFFWVGVYFKEGNKLTIGPYQGPVACQELKYPGGVCWASVIEKKTIIVPDVSKFAGHIACDSRSKSEIVIPLFNSNHELYGVLDIDSTKPDNFDEADKEGLELITSLLRLE